MSGCFARSTIRPSPGGFYSMNLWDDVLARIENDNKVNRHSFATWFRPTTYQSLEESRLIVGVPNAQFKDWLSKNYQGVIAEALDELGHGDIHVVFEDATERALSPRPRGAERESSSLNPKYTFESFVVGASNQFAHAAARAVAEIPSKSYNPLFIYGGVGLGKTHLMHAVGHYIQARQRRLEPRLHLDRPLHQRDDQRHPLRPPPGLPPEVPRPSTSSSWTTSSSSPARTAPRRSSSTSSTRSTTPRSRSSSRATAPRARSRPSRSGFTADSNGA